MFYTHRSRAGSQTGTENEESLRLQKHVSADAPAARENTAFPKLETSPETRAFRQVRLRRTNDITCIFVQ